MLYNSNLAREYFILHKNYGSRSKKSEKVRLSLTDNALHRKLRKR